jgi:hypothetical protein
VSTATVKEGLLIKPLVKYGKKGKAIPITGREGP